MLRSAIALLLLCPAQLVLNEGPQGARVEGESDGVGKERSPTNRRVETAVGGAETKKRVVPFRCVASGIVSVRWRTDCLRDGHQPEAEECKCDKN